MASRGIAYVVFILPIAFSLFFGSVVMADILSDPNRNLQVTISEGQTHSSSRVIDFIGLKSQYSVSESVEIQVEVSDYTYDCGDLYITIYDLGTPQKEVVTQSGFFTQCFGQSEPILPVDDEFSEIIDKPGTYEVEVQLYDPNQLNSERNSAKIIVG